MRSGTSWAELERAEKKQAMHEAIAGGRTALPPRVLPSGAVAYDCPCCGATIERDTGARE